MSKPLDEFGALVIEHLRDSGFEFIDMMELKKWKAPDLRETQRAFAGLKPEARTAAKRAAQAAIDHAVHEFLFNLFEACESGRIELKVSGKHLHKLSDGFHGELFTKSGWIARFSQYDET